jgi:hypothetical protein
MPALHATTAVAPAAPSPYLDPVLLSVEADNPDSPTQRWTGTYRATDDAAEGPMEVRLSLDPSGGRLRASVSVEEGYLRLLKLTGNIDHVGRINLRSDDGTFDVYVRGVLTPGRKRISGQFELTDLAGNWTTGKFSLRVR